MNKRLTKESGFEAYNGNELIVKGALEGGVSLITGYPGSPVADVFEAASSIRDTLQTHGVMVQLANNEALSVARVNGAQMEDIRAMTVMKSVGFHVAADGLALGNLSKFGKKGGAVVVVGDDPWTDSTQVPADSRYLARHLQMPVMEPSGFQEMKDWVKLAFELSRDADLYILYLITTNQADGGGVVEVFPNQYPKINIHHQIQIDTRKIPVNETVILPPRTARRETDLKKRFQRLFHECREKGVNRILNLSPKTEPYGFIVSGLAFNYLEHALSELGLDGRFPILKLGMTFPIDPEVIVDFAGRVEKIIVIEERRGFIEEQIAAILKDAFQAGRQSEPKQVWGKMFPNNIPGIPSTRGLNPSILIQHIGELILHSPIEGIDLEKVKNELKLIHHVATNFVDIPVRSPTFCPGCPHRDSSSVLLEIKKDFTDPVYMKRNHKTRPIDLLFHGDTGCYTMLMFDPNKDLMHNYSGMGLGGGTGAGIDPFITNKQVVFMGDSTFFHSGMGAISDSIKHHQDITYIILDNQTTAMTGHQPTPESETDVLGNSTFGQRIESILNGMVHGASVPVVRINPSYRETYRKVLEKSILKDGVKIIIADKECGISYQRKQRREKARILRHKGYLPQEEFINVTAEVCEYCLECAKLTGCPGLSIEKTDEGSKMGTDLSTCVADMACVKINACPSFEKVIVKRSRKPTDLLFGIDLERFPEPKTLKVGGQWRTYVAGVGGMGIGVLTAVLVLAGRKEKYNVLFCDKKGLAVRNGGVYSQITFLKKPFKVSPIIPYGKADLLWGLDPLEAVRALDPKIHLRVGSSQYTTAFINLHKTPTIRNLMGLDAFSLEGLEDTIKKCTKENQYYGFDFSCIAERYLGSKLYANLLMLGSAYQKGMLPLSSENIITAIQETIGSDLKKNIMAFNLGRRLTVSPELFKEQPPAQTFQAFFEEKQMSLEKNHVRGKRFAEIYRELVQGALTQLMLDEETLIKFASAVYYLVQYDRISYVQSYISQILSLYHKDRIDLGFQALKAAIPNLAKVMLIKDEIYVSSLLTSPEKIQRDKVRYNIVEKNGDRIIYRHFTRPEFRIWGIKLQFNLVTRNWQLSMMKHFKFLRRLLPHWHQDEKEFRDWYRSLLDRFDSRDETLYSLYVQALKVPEGVRGYRKIRYAKMQDARIKVNELLGKDFSEPGAEKSELSKSGPNVVYSQDRQ